MVEVTCKDFLGGLHFLQFKSLNKDLSHTKCKKFKLENGTTHQNWQFPTWWLLEMDNSIIVLLVLGSIFAILLLSVFIHQYLLPLYGFHHTAHIYQQVEAVHNSDTVQSLTHDLASESELYLTTFDGESDTEGDSDGGIVI
jgi:hypothetical protein